MSGLCIFKATLLSHDFLNFVTFNLASATGEEGICVPYVHNYAIMYSLMSSKRVVDIGTQRFTPSYEELRNLDFYATPARPKNVEIRRVQYNTLDEGFARRTIAALTKEEPRVTLSFFGARQCILPYSEFSFFLASQSKPPKIIRLGKDRSPCLLEFEQLKIVKKMKGTFRCSHLINIADYNKLKDIHVIKISMSPTPLFDGEFEGEYILCEGVKDKYIVALPERLFLDVKAN
jgi:CRISPR type I-D-associated protein Csc1